jgi:hypothetical protein
MARLRWFALIINHLEGAGNAILIGSAERA